MWQQKHSTEQLRGWSKERNRRKESLPEQVEDLPAWEKLTVQGITKTYCQKIKKKRRNRMTNTVEPCLTTTPLIRPPRYYGHFILTRKKLSQSFSYLKKPFNMTTPLIRPIFHGPKGVVLTGFHCTSNTKRTCYLCLCSTSSGHQCFSSSRGTIQ